MINCTQHSIKQINGLACPLCQIDIIMQSDSIFDVERKEKIIILIVELNSHLISLDKEHEKLKGKYQNIYDRIQKTSLPLRRAIVKRLEEPIKQAVELCLKTHFYNDGKFLEYVKKYKSASAKLSDRPKPGRLHYLTVMIFRKTIISMLENHRITDNNELQKIRDEHVDDFRDDTRKKVDKMMMEIEKKSDYDS